MIDWKRLHYVYQKYKCDILAIEVLRKNVRDESWKLKFEVYLKRIKILNSTEWKCLKISWWYEFLDVLFVQFDQFGSIHRSRIFVFNSRSEVATKMITIYHYVEHSLTAIKPHRNLPREIRTSDGCINSIAFTSFSFKLSLASWKRRNWNEISQKIG